MVAMLIASRHAIEQERVYVVVECLVIQEELTQKTQISAPGSLPPAVNFEEADHLIAIDFVSRRVQQSTLAPVSLELPLVAKVKETHLADVHQLAIRIFNRIWREIPGLNLMSSHLYLL